MTTTVQRTEVRLRTRLGDIFRRRAILRRLVISQLKVKYEQAVLGYLWSVLEPLLLTAVYFFVFSVVINRDIVPDYPVFLISGILPWIWLTSTMTNSMTALTGNAKLITKVYVPREIFPLSVVGAKTVDFLLSQFVLVGVVLIFRHPPTIYLLAYPLALLIQITLLVGLALFLSPITALLSDVQRVTRPVIRAMFYMSPVLYPVTLVFSSELAQIWKTLYRLNPVVGILQLYRSGWYGDQFVGGWINVGISASGALIMLVVGWIVFVRLEPSVLKEL